MEGDKVPASVQYNLSWTQSTASPPEHRRRHRRFTLRPGSHWIACRFAVRAGNKEVIYSMLEGA